MEWSTIAGYVATGVVSLLVGLILANAKPRAKLVFWQNQAVQFNLGGQQVQTFAVTVWNKGRAAANAVEIVHQRPPTYFVVYPTIPFNQDSPEGGGSRLKFEHLAPKESVTIAYFDVAQTANPILIRCKEGQAEYQQMELSEYVEPVYQWIGALLVIGFGMLLGGLIW